MNTRLIIGGLLFAASTVLFAQSPGSPPSSSPDAKKAPHREHREMRSCDQAPDPARCEARRKERHEQMSQAREACKATEGSDRGQCMMKQMCAKSADTTKCETHAKQRMEHR